MTRLESDSAADGSSERFGFSWDIYSELRQEHEAQFLLWTAPLQSHDWQGKSFLDAGCGMGRNSYWPMRFGATRGLAIDVDERSLVRARETLRDYPAVGIRNTSIYDVSERDCFDIVFSIGVVHHLADPVRAVASLVKAVKPGGLVLLWLYGRENNGWIVWFFDPIRRFLFSLMPLWLVHKLSWPLTAMLWVLLRMGLGRTPYIDLIRGFDFRHLRAIVFDHMIPRIARYYTKSEAIDLLAGAGLQDVKAVWTNQMSWTVSATKVPP